LPKTFWTLILMGGAVVLVGSYELLTIMSREPTMSMAMPLQGVSMRSGAVTEADGGNPLLSADKAAVSRWFPGQCFAELYVKAPSFGGRLIPSCVADVIKHVKADTGVTLSQADIQSPEVLAHFKQVYGTGNPWRQ
jgi:hypothetical protein